MPRRQPGAACLSSETAPRALLRRLFDAAVAAADPARSCRRICRRRRKGRTVVVGAGKASAAMARAVEDHWAGPLDGLVVTRYGHGVPCQRIEIVEAAHPVPDAAGERRRARILRAGAAGSRADDLVLCLISGGGSALLALPAPGLTLADKQAVNRALLRIRRDDRRDELRAQAPVGDQGRPARRRRGAGAGGELLISDVPGDDPAVIASGPTVADPTTFADARAVLRRYAHRRAARR